MLALILQELAAGYDNKAWHGSNLKGSLRGVTAFQAAWRPAGGRHNIWEVAVHAAYWKYAVRRRLTGERRGSFPLKGSNWFVRPEPGTAEDRWARAWARDRALLEQEHGSLVRAVRGMDPKRLSRIDMVFGIAYHDVYHAGQIQLLKRLRPAGAV
jgi:DinB superfamily